MATVRPSMTGSLRNFWNAQGLEDVPGRGLKITRRNSSPTMEQLAGTFNG